MVVGYICESDPFVDRNLWSGTIFKIREAIENAGFEVIWIPFDNMSKKVLLWERIRWKLYDLLGKKQILGGVHFLPELYLYAKSVKKDETFNKCDVLFFPRAGQIGLFLNTDKPIIYYSDATAHVMVDYYWKNCHPLSVKMACYLDKKASQKAALNMRSSKWAADSVVNDCKCDTSKSVVLEFGANVDDDDFIPIQPYHEGPLHILFSGVEWERKGGDIAVETVRSLRRRGLDAILHIVGIKDLPESCKGFDYIISHGFYNKRDLSEYKKYIEVFRGCHIMLLPTQAECSAIVYCEAAGFGLPTYTYATGGTTNYVVNGINGCTLPPKSSADEFADVIMNDIKGNRMDRLHEGALNLYRDKLSWGAWSKRFKDIMREYMPNVNNS